MKNLIKACEVMAPAMIDRIHLYQSTRNIFEVFEVEQQFQKALRRKVWLKNGGFLVIDETEALTAIDVNSGKYVGSEDQDQVILHTNLAACEVISTAAAPAGSWRPHRHRFYRYDQP
jgi:ribonuclease G